MKGLKKTDSIFRWIILGIAIANILTYFMPIYESVYRGGEPELIYLYGSSSSSLVVVGFTNLLIPIISLIFLFANFKNSKLFFYGFSLTYILNSIFTLIILDNAVSNNSNSYYAYSFKYGYYFYIITSVLLAVTVICSFIFYLIIKKKNPNGEESNAVAASTKDSKIDAFKQRIEVLNDLKNQGILTESEYDQKRSEIVKDLEL